MLNRLLYRFSNNASLISLLRRLGLLKLAYRIRQTLYVLVLAQRQKVNPFSPPPNEGIPLPNLWQIVLVAGNVSMNSFLVRGKQGVEALTNMLTTQGLSFGDFHVVLDFGCGVGRVTRHLKPLSNWEIHGCDYNSALIAWCQKHLTFATFKVNQLAPPLPYSDAQFDLIFAFSVFTHLDEKLTHSWIRELARVLRPGGYLVFSVMGEASATRLKFNPAEWQSFRAGNLVVRYGEASGMNMTGSFCNVEYVKSQMTQELTFINYIPQGALGNPIQDLVLMRKPE
ncbi:MAG: class I SAM-dependent methyltransferase [Chloroflexota bacterium]